MAFNLSQALSGAGAGVAEVAGEAAKGEIRRMNEEQLIDKRTGVEQMLMRERSALEEARAVRLEELRSGQRIKEADLAADREVTTQTRLTPTLVQRAEQMPYTQAEGTTRVAPSTGEVRTAEKTPTPLTAAQERVYNAHAGVYEAQPGLINSQINEVNARARRIDAETGAIQRGERYARGNQSAQVERDVSSALGTLRGVLREKDEMGQPRYDTETHAQRIELAGQAVRAGVPKEEAVRLATEAPVMSPSAIRKQAEADYKAAKPTFGSNIGDMTKDEYIAHRVKVRGDHAASQLEEFRRENGLGRSRGGAAPRGTQGDRSSGIPQEAVDLLKANPDKASDFDQMFGPGAAERVLGKSSSDAQGEYQDNERLVLPSVREAPAEPAPGAQEQADLSKPARARVNVGRMARDRAREGLIDSLL